MRAQARWKISDGPSLSTPDETSPHCPKHPGVVARWSCSVCDVAACDACIRIKQSSQTRFEACPSCGGPCRAIVAPPPPARAELRSAFLYPLRGSGPMLLMAGTLVLSLLKYLPFIGPPLGLGLYFGYGLTVLQSSMRGESDAPEYPDFTEPTDLLWPLVLGWAAMLMSFGPAACVAYSGNPDVAYYSPHLLALGLLYVPGAFMTAGLSERVFAVIPLTVIPVILRLGAIYGIAVAVTWAAFFVLYVADVLIDAQRSLIVSVLAPQLVALYVLMTTARVYGLICASRRSDLGWD